MQAKLYKAANLQSKICEYIWYLEKLGRKDPDIDIIWRCASDKMKMRFKEEVMNLIKEHLQNLRKELDEL